MDDGGAPDCDNGTDVAGVASDAALAGVVAGTEAPPEEGEPDVSFAREFVTPVAAEAAEAPVAVAPVTLAALPAPVDSVALERAEIGTTEPFDSVVEPPGEAVADWPEAGEATPVDAESCEEIGTDVIGTTSPFEFVVEPTITGALLPEGLLDTVGNVVSCDSPPEVWGAPLPDSDPGRTPVARVDGAPDTSVLGTPVLTLLPPVKAPVSEIDPGSTPVGAIDEAPENSVLTTPVLTPLLPVGTIVGKTVGPPVDAPVGSAVTSPVDKGKPVTETGSPLGKVLRPGGITPPSVRVLGP